MRKLWLLAAMIGCGGGGSNNTDTTDGTTKADAPTVNTVDAPTIVTTGDTAFSVTSTPFMLGHGVETTKCFYFTTSNDSEVLVDRWDSLMTTGSHHMIVFLNPGGSQPADGTIDDNCGIGGGTGSNQPIWTYASQTAGVQQTQLLPTDDGHGKPLAQVVPAHTKGYIQMHYLNSSDDDMMVHVELKAHSLAAGTAYTQTDAYITYQYNIDIGPGATGVTVSSSCAVPNNVQFWQMSTHAHQQAVHTQVTDGSGMVFQSDDWEHPGVREFAPQYYTFTNKLTYACTYDNVGPNKNSEIKQGQSAATNEMCMATGYYFPATGPKFCVSFGASCQCL